MTSTVDRTAFTAVAEATGKARGLPNACYLDPAILAVERQRVFFDQWAGVGFGKDVPEAGDARPVDFHGTPLLMLRDQHGEVRVFQNACRHRGMILVDRPTRLRGTIRCPYHSWCYALDGALKSTPHVGGPGKNRHPDIDRASLGLIPIRSHVWRDVVFVNVSGSAPPFESYAADLIERWREFEVPQHHGGPDSSIAITVRSNWKLAVENFCESYHLPWIHPDLNSYSRLEDHYTICGDGPWSGQGTLVYRPAADSSGQGFADYPGLSDKWDTSAEYIALYPNVLLGVHRDHSFAILLESASPEQTLERIELYYAAADMAGEAYAEQRRRNAERWKVVFDEDVSVVEGMQRGRHAVLFDGGRFSPVMDTATHHFHQWVASRLTG